ncbi:MAG TPA: hypothetical protein VM888_04040 [Chitinophagaceae bacterium]|nr:hypothetical protein [Chitinophagaceae bacterium]
MLPTSFNRHPASYRDPSGFVYCSEGHLYRQVNKVFKEDYEHFIKSGYAQQLIDSGSMIPFEEVAQMSTVTEDGYKIIKPLILDFISYPYEWSFTMLKDAALLTLSLAKEAIKYGLLLKDATPYNIQFYRNKPVLIDTLSFELIDTTKPWIAYRQFCESFLAPLALMHYSKMPLQALLLTYPDGIPLPITQKLLPLRSKINLNTYLHLHLHSSYSNNSAIGNKEKSIKFSETKFINILENLEKTVSSYTLHHKAIWSGYYNEAQQRPDYITQKKEVIERWINNNSSIKKAIDVGANEGLFSELLASKNILTIAADFDHFSIDELYKRNKEKGEKNIHSLLIDLSNPSPAIGLNNKERASLMERVQCDLVLALAVLHHLCIGKNIPFAAIALFLKSLGKVLIIEFVPKEDEKIALMLQQKKDIYPWYTEKEFTESFSTLYEIKERQEIKGSKRVLYLMERHAE